MTCQGISLGLVSIGCCFFLSVTRRGLLFVLHTENRGRSRGFFVPNLRILELFLHTDCRGGHGFFGPDFFPCPEFANLRIFSSHGESRNNLFYHELSNIFHTECRGGHGVSLSRIFEFSNFFFTRKVAEITDFLYPETCPWTH